ncbi:MAG: DUF3179 domain-containing protein [Lysobacter sp.]|nr:DUF3179 domain-containing protein [Lysobacter sp.]
MLMNLRHTLVLLALGLAVAGPVMAAAIPTGEPATVHATLQKYWGRSLSGGPPKDGIPSIDNPRFENAAQADRWLEDGSRVIGLYRNGQARAYPQSLLVWHEIVNDTVSGDAIAITYCPLTGTALGFERGKDELGVSGRLVNSNLIMYNRATDTHWPQILAAGIHGPEKGKGLKEVRVVWTDWASWKQRHPETKVLSRQTGYARNYRRDAYGSYNPPSGYYAGGGTLFPVFAKNDRFSQKHEVLGFRTANEAVAIDPAALAKAGHLRHAGKNADFLIIHDPGLGTGWVYRAVSGGLPGDEDLADLAFAAKGPTGKALAGLEPINAFEAMWFAWYAFYPDTVVIGKP